MDRKILLKGTSKQWDKLYKDNKNMFEGDGSITYDDEHGESWSNFLITIGTVLFLARAVVGTIKFSVRAFTDKPIKEPKPVPPIQLEYNVGDALLCGESKDYATLIGKTDKQIIARFPAVVDSGEIITRPDYVGLACDKIVELDCDTAEGLNCIND